MQRLGLASVIAAKPCRERDLVLAMVAAREVAPHTKLAEPPAPGPTRPPSIWSQRPAPRSAARWR